ncbi:MAG: hypothetical protein U1E57_04265 [Paenacidovorax caeni]
MALNDRTPQAPRRNIIQRPIWSAAQECKVRKDRAGRASVVLLLHSTVFTMPFLRLSSAPIVGALLTLAASAHAQDSAWQPFVSVSPVYQGYSDIDDGGRFKVSGAIVRGGAFYAMGAGSRVGVTLNYDQYDYSFDNAGAFGTQAPWVRCAATAFRYPVSWAAGWLSMSVAPSVDWFGEKGASSSDSRVWAPCSRVSSSSRAAIAWVLALACTGKLEKPAPFPCVGGLALERALAFGELKAAQWPDWAGRPEFDYRLDGGWTLGGGFSYCSVRFRFLADRPLARGGVGGRKTGVPLFFAGNAPIQSQMALHVYGGAVVGGKLRLEMPQATW